MKLQDDVILSHSERLKITQSNVKMVISLFWSFVQKPASSALPLKGFLLSLVPPPCVASAPACLRLPSPLKPNVSTSDSDHAPILGSSYGLILIPDLQHSNVGYIDFYAPSSSNFRFFFFFLSRTFWPPQWHLQRSPNNVSISCVNSLIFRTVPDVLKNHAMKTTPTLI